jgi:hypothetical protein
MKRRAKTVVSTKIEANKDKIYRISDPIQLAEVFFPARNAHNRRAAFLAIMIEIKDAKDQRLETTDHIAREYGLSQSSITKARTKMSRIGLIRKHEGYWIFSTVFAKSLESLVNKLNTYQAPSCSSEEFDRQRAFVEMAKTIS